MKEITISVDGQEIKAQISEEELKKLMQEPEWPQAGDDYWYLSGINVQGATYNANYFLDTMRTQVGNVYRTAQDAKDALRAKELIAAVAKRRKELNGGWKPDWDDVCENKWIISHSILYGDFRPANFIVNHTLPTFGFFKNEQDVIDVIDEFRDELDYYFKERYPEERG